MKFITVLEQFCVSTDSWRFNKQAILSSKLLGTAFALGRQHGASWVLRSNRTGETMDTSGKLKLVYTIVERGAGKSYWTRVGVGFLNGDGSLNLRLDAVPITGMLQVRDYEPREFDKRLGIERPPNIEHPDMMQGSMSA